MGREFAQLPAEWSGQRVCRILLNSLEVSRYHALIVEEQGQIVIIDQNSANGVLVNGEKQTRAPIAPGDTIGDW